MNADPVTSLSPLFPTTRWDMIAQLRSDLDEEQMEALEVLCATYWKPIYERICSRLREGEAEDVTQSFFRDQAIRMQLFLKADPAKGLLRNLIICAVDRFVNTYLRLQVYSPTRGGDVQRLSLDHPDAKYVLQKKAIDQESPGDAFCPSDLKIGEEAHAAILNRIEYEYRQAGKSRVFEVLSWRLNERKSAGYDEDAAKLGISRSNARVLTCRMRGRYHELAKILTPLVTKGA